MNRADRMKSYETPWQLHIPPKSYTILRVDGRAFHTLTKNMVKPFDHDFMEAMNLVAVALCDEIQGAQFAYVQSDEVSVLITGFNSNAQQWFGGEVIKMVSISAAVATRAFGTQGVFDSRVFTVPTRMEAINYFLARQADCVRNAIQMVAQAHFSQKELHGKKTPDMINMLAGKGIKFGDQPARARMGGLATCVQKPAVVTYTHKKTQQVMEAHIIRNVWECGDAPWFDWDERSYLELNIPVRDDAEDLKEDNYDD